MKLSEEEIRLQKEAINYIYSHKEELIYKFIESKKPLKLDLFTFFMAGSPGAGKTEFSRRYMNEEIDSANQKLFNRVRDGKISIDDAKTLFVRIDVDEIREFIPQYQKTDIGQCIKGNAHVVQKAANRGLDILRKYCLQNGISFLHDGTFGNYDTMRDLVKKSLRKSRSVQIFYIYLDPLVAWEFTRAREFLEGRNIVKEKFIEQFFASKENVARIKKEFGNKIRITCIIKNANNDPEEIRNVDDIDKFIIKYYNKKSLKAYTEESLRELIPNV